MLALKARRSARSFREKFQAAVITKLWMVGEAKGAAPSAGVEFGEADLVAFEEEIFG